MEYLYYKNKAPFRVALTVFMNCRDPNFLY